MIEFPQMLLLGAGAFLGSTIAAVAGFGGAVILLPILVAVFGVRDAIPILTVIQLIGNGSRVWFNRYELSLPVVGWFALGSIPAALIGGLLFASVPLSALTKLLGVFFIAIVVYRHMAKGKLLRIPLRGFSAVGAVLSFFSALLGTIGPLMVPFFLAYGLVKGAFIGTEALATVVMHITKLVVYGGTAVLTVSNTIVGLSLAPIMVFGSFIGKRIVDKLPERLFVLIIEATLVVAGINFLIRG